MPRVPQYPYCSPEAMELRRRDGTRPWEYHPCEVDSLPDDDDNPALAEARRLRAEIEAQP